jgi:hypothetical protein
MEIVAGSEPLMERYGWEIETTARRLGLGYQCPTPTSLCILVTRSALDIHTSYM